MNYKKASCFILLMLSLVFNCLAQQTTPFIVVDQFGYRLGAEKIAVIRDPQTGFDASSSFVPGAEYALVDASTLDTVWKDNLAIWNNGLEDSTSGDKAWWFDFSAIRAEGDYYVLDLTNNVRSYTFSIGEDIYDDVLKNAVRTFFYQRLGFAKNAPFAEANWEDGASHIGALQDKNCRSYDDPNNANTEKDVSGGWFDAGDYNKYTTWTANYIYEMMQAYEENPNAWTDDYNLPESGNNIPDLIDEAKWGMDHLLRLQKADGSMISVVSVDHASPPSSASGQSLYGGVNTSCTWNSASTFAYGAKVFGELGFAEFATQLEAAAINAYTWAEENPNVIWRNNDADYNSVGIGSGQQEVNDYGRLGYQMRAALHLFELTEEAKYQTFFDDNYSDIHLVPWYFAYPFEVREQEILLYYTTLANATVSIKNTILSRYENAIDNNDYNLNAFDNSWDPYMSPLSDYVWGSNSTKSLHGTMFYDAIIYETNSSREDDLKTAAERYIHYIHGVNPMNLCYLSNMYNKGAENCVNQFYHSWFSNNTDWDEVGVSTYGPAPGFLVGGPNESYNWDGCCPNNCGGTTNNSICTSLGDKLPVGQPAQKSYLDFNTSWPLNSWEITENSCGYQIAYIRLLSKFVDRSDIVNGVEKSVFNDKIKIYPNPTSKIIHVSTFNDEEILEVNLYNIHGELISSDIKLTNNSTIDLSSNSRGIYLINVKIKNDVYTQRIILQ